MFQGHASRTSKTEKNFSFTFWWYKIHHRAYILKADPFKLLAAFEIPAFKKEEERHAVLMSC